MVQSICIVGGNSFVASFLMKALEREYPLSHLTLLARRDDFSFLTGEYTFKYMSMPEAPMDYDLLLDCDVIIYCVSAGVQANKEATSELVMQTNFTEPANLLNYLEEKKFKGKFISFGSYFEIGLTSQQKAFSEKELVTHQNDFPNEYCKAKSNFSRFLAAQNFSFDVLHLVLPTVYGAGENPKRLIPYIVESVYEKLPLKFTAGGQVRQYVHIMDVADLVVKLVNTHDVSGIYNLGSEDILTVKELVDKAFAVLTNARAQIPQVEFGAIQKRDQAMSYLTIDDSKARRALGWDPKVPLEEGIRDYILTKEQAPAF